MNLSKRILVAFTAILVGFSAHAQILKPVKWVFSVKQTKADEATLVFTATIDKTFHVYSQFVENGPSPTVFDFKKSKEYELVGKVQESKPIEEYDINFDTKLKYFETKAIFKQTIKIKSAKDFKVAGVLNYMSCNDKMCLPPEDVDFSFAVKGNTIVPPSIVEAITPIAADAIPLAPNDSLKPTKSSAKDSMANSTATAVVKADMTGITSKPESTLWQIFIKGLIGGFAALLMPCIFPMLPLTVSYFTKKNHSRIKSISTALVYGLSIIVFYVALGLGVTVIFGSDALNEVASNGAFNFVFFLLLVVFAASLLGAFEITLPSWVVNASDKKSEKAGLVGIFFMAITLALVSFSCTGPIIGTLLVDAASKGQYMGPAVGMFGFSLALALPFALFAMFPSWMNSLPKSGGWLNSVKVVLGFLELALALKFLSNVDLAYHWRILDREVFLVLWIIIFALLGFYLLGKLKFSHDSDLKFISIPRLFFAIASLSFALYMVPGLWGAPLKAISAFSPPESTQDFDLTRATYAPAHASADESGPKKHADIFHCPHGLNCFFDFEEGVAYAKKVGKPVFIDFTGWSCVNCRKMEASVWSDPRVLERFNEDYILISLYVDDKTALPLEDQYVSTFSGKKIKTLGNKWSDLQASKYGTNSQPYYVLLNQKGEVLTTPQGFDLNVDQYVQFLDEGKKAYGAKK